MILTLGRRSVHRRRHAYIAREGTPRFDERVLAVLSPATASFAWKLDEITRTGAEG
jgi:hypothetical protein